MAITYDAGTNTITITGYTEATPCTFLDIYNADIAGGWGKVTRQCTNQYCIQAKIQIGDGSTATWFADTKQQITFDNLFSSDTWANEIFNVLANAHFRLGEHVSGKLTKNGCAIFIAWTSAWRCSIIDGNSVSGAVEIYDFTLMINNANTHRFYRCEGGKFYNLLGTSVMYGISFQVCHNLDVYNVTQQRAGLIVHGSDGTFDRILIGDTTMLVAVDQNSTADAVLKNVDVIGTVSHSLLRGYKTSYDIYVINTQSTSWVCSYVSYGGKFYRQYEVNLKVQDKDENAINGATVKIWDKDDNLVVDTTTGADGKIATQTLNFGYYRQAGGSTPVMQTPHKIQIRKAGTNYLTYETDFTLTKKTDWVIMMVDMSDLINEINANEVKIDAIEAKLDVPNNFKADVSDLAKEVTVEDVKVRIDDLEVLGIQKQ